MLRLFPVLRRAWALRGEQAHVPITGRNAKRVLFGAINLRTGHRVVLRRPTMQQAYFQAFLRLLREAYPGRQLALLLDEAPGHRAARSLALATQLDTAGSLQTENWRVDLSTATGTPLKASGRFLENARVLVGDWKRLVVLYSNVLVAIDW